MLSMVRAQPDDHVSLLSLTQTFVDSIYGGIPSKRIWRKGVKWRLSASANVESVDSRARIETGSPAQLGRHKCF